MKRLGFVSTDSLRTMGFMMAALALLGACQPVVEVVEVEVTRQEPAQVLEVTRVVTEQLPAPVVTAEVVTKTVEQIVLVTPAPAGSDERPLEIVFPATVAEGIIAGRGEALITALAAETGRVVELVIAPDTRAAAERVCAEPDRAVAFLPALPAEWIQARCGAQPALVGVRADVPWHAGMFVVRAGAVGALAELDGARWGVADTTAVARTLAATATLTAAGIRVAEPSLYGNDNNALLALLNDEVDVVSVAFSPPILPFAERPWAYGEDDPELWRALGVSPSRHPIGYVEVLRGGPEVGGYRVRDARAALFDARPTVFDETRVLALTDPLPNGVLVLGAGVPWVLAGDVIDTVERFANGEACAQSICAPDFYNWEGMVRVAPDAFEPVRALVETLALDEDARFASDPEY